MQEKGRAGDAAKFREQLGLLSLRIVEVTADGNCFFRCAAASCTCWWFAQVIYGYLSCEAQQLILLLDDYSLLQISGASRSN